MATEGRYKVLVCGAREYTNHLKIYERLAQLPAKSFIIEGGAAGADTIAAIFAKEHGWPCIHVEANWKFYGKSAGHIRNAWMLDLEPNIVLAFHPNISESKGTKNCVEKAKKLGIPVEINT